MNGEDFSYLLSELYVNQCHYVITERRTPGGEEARKKEEEEAAGETLAGRTLTAVSAKIAVVNAVILSAVTETAEMIVNKDPHPEMMMVSRA